MNQETLEIIAIICLFAVTFASGLFAGTFVGERVSGGYKKKFSDKCKECELTYSTLEETRQKVRFQSGEIDGLKDKLRVCGEEKCEIKSQYVELKKRHERYVEGFDELGKMAMKKGYAFDCNMNLREKGLPMIQNSSAYLDKAAEVVVIFSDLKKGIRHDNARVD